MVISLLSAEEGEDDHGNISEFLRKVLKGIVREGSVHLVRKNGLENKKTTLCRQKLKVVLESVNTLLFSIILP
ncbi:hypothetical protein [Peribacillus tepidiphilus]|uniref:hypothetical protein n=1 Tax=Peribacillus tepidiphilus TaxID=2652445 RepID=UPI0035B4FDF9